MYNSGLTVWYNVHDLELTLVFYTEKLGFKVLNHDAGKGQARLATNTKRLLYRRIRTIPGLVKLAAFKDPDGHDLMLSEKLN